MAWPCSAWRAARPVCLRVWELAWSLGGEEKGEANNGRVRGGGVWVGALASRNWVILVPKIFP